MSCEMAVHTGTTVVVLHNHTLEEGAVPIGTILAIPVLNITNYLANNGLSIGLLS